MQRLGRILRQTRRNMLLARADEAPKVNWGAYDAKGRIIGKVYDVFGPITKPYILIKVQKKETNIRVLAKEKIYFSEIIMERKGKWRRKKKK